MAAKTDRDAAVLRMRRPQLWLCGMLTFWRRHSEPTNHGPWFVMTGLVLGLLLAQGMLVLGAGVVCILGFPAGFLAVFLLNIGSHTWYGNGAGRPVLSISEGRVRGRLRPIWSDWPAIRHNEPEWWDFDVAASELRGVRIRDNWPGGPVLILDLPEEVAARLLAEETIGGLPKHWQNELGSPTAWQVGLLELALLRRRTLRRLVSALRAAGAPAEDRR